MVKTRQIYDDAEIIQNERKEQKLVAAK